jgi:hypothetical protein
MSSGAHIGLVKKRANPMISTTKARIRRGGIDTMDSLSMS